MQYTLHTGTLVDPNDKKFQSAGGNYLFAGLVFNNPDAHTPVNATATYVRGQSFVWGGGDSGIDLNLGATVQPLGQVNNRTVSLLASPYVAANVYFPGPGDTQINIEGNVGSNLGLAGVHGGRQAGDPSVPASLLLGGGIGIQKQVGEKGDYSIGFEALVTTEPKANIAGPAGLTLPPISFGGVFTLAVY